MKTIYFLKNILRNSIYMVIISIKSKFKLLFYPSISVWSSSFSLSQFGPHFLKNDLIWSLSLNLTRRC